jgi:biotin transport system substrate-specific component
MKTKNLAVTALFTALAIVFSQLILPLPFTPIPISLSLFPVFLAGTILPKRYAAYSQLVYLLLGAVGLPVFAGFKGGMGIVFGPTGGFLLAYPIMAFLTAWMIALFHRKTIVSYIIAILAALAVCYLCGSLWYVFVGHVSLVKSISATIIPFLAFDCIKVGICAVLAVSINKALIKSKLILDV